MHLSYIEYSSSPYNGKPLLRLNCEKSEETFVFSSIFFTDSSGTAAASIQPCIASSHHSGLYLDILMENFPESLNSILFTEFLADAVLSVRYNTKSLFSAKNSSESPAFSASESKYPEYLLLRLLNSSIDLTTAVRDSFTFMSSINPKEDMLKKLQLSIRFWS